MKPIRGGVYTTIPVEEVRLEDILIWGWPVVEIRYGPVLVGEPVYLTLVDANDDEHRVLLGRDYVSILITTKVGKPGRLRLPHPPLRLYLDRVIEQ